jgi:peroxiredoxin
MPNAAICAGTIGLAVLGLGTGGCASGDGADPAPAGAAERGPGLPVGRQAPNATVTARDGRPVELADLYAEGPIVLTFYRGGWCPYCTRHLTEWQGRIEELADAGATLIALTPESPGNAAQTASEHGLGFDVYSDHAMEAAQAYRLGFALDDQTISKYRGFGVDLASRNAAGTWELPAPGAFVIDRNGVIRYAWADWDYTKRADPDEVIAAVRALR